MEKVKTIELGFKHLLIVAIIIIVVVYIALNYVKGQQSEEKRTAETLEEILENADTEELIKITEEFLEKRDGGYQKPILTLDTCTVDKYGIGRIYGTIKNPTGKTLKMVNVKGMLYRDGKLVDVERDYFSELGPYEEDVISIAFTKEIPFEECKIIVE